MICTQGHELYRRKLTALIESVILNKRNSGRNGDFCQSRMRKCISSETILTPAPKLFSIAMVEITSFESEV